MTEADWNRCTDADAMLSFLWQSRKSTDRQDQLFAVAYARRFWQVLEERSRKAIEVGERYADRNATEEQLDHAWKTAYTAAMNCKNKVRRGAWAAVACALPAEAAITLDVARDNEAEVAVQCDLLREIIGNPFRSVAVKRSWLRCQHGAVRKLAGAIYDERRWQDLPVLADALEEAGCTNKELLHHCRSAGPHTRGCWAVDLLLGRARRGSTQERAARKIRPPRPWPKHPEGPKRFRRFARDVPENLAELMQFQPEPELWHRLLVCSCGKKKAFQFKYLGVLLPDGGIQDPKDTLQKCKLTCRNCGRTIDLFDPCRHGHEGVLGFHRESDVPGRRATRKYSCTCGGDTFSVVVSACYDLWDDEEEQEGFDASNRDESYGWFHTHLICSRCQKVYYPISYECR